jgi:hypothetical protein
MALRECDEMFKRARAGCREWNRATRYWRLDLSGPGKAGGVVGIKDGERVELVIEGAWFEKFPWSRQFLNPQLDQRSGAPAFAITGMIVMVSHQAGVIVKTDGCWDSRGGRHEGYEIFVPWAYVVGILEISRESTGVSRAGFL